MRRLEDWKSSPHQKPLLIEGARQVGKSWLMKEFGAANYHQTLKVDFNQDEDNPHAGRLQTIFSGDLHPERIIAALELEYDISIDPDNTLLIFDEIQEVPRALTSLKYFNEDAPQYQILAAGSQMGITLHQGASFPVGQVSSLKLYPMNFDEFLYATERKRFAELLDAGDWQMAETFKETYREALIEYYLIGGMPEVVAGFCRDRDFRQARITQLELLKGYRRDYSKHAPALLNARIQEVFNSIPQHLAKENKKFVWGAIRPGARSRDFELAVQWIVDCAQAYKVPLLEQPIQPIETYCNQEIFKLYLHDVGLLCAMYGVDPQIALDEDSVFREFKGTLTEQYVLQQLEYLIENDPFMSGPAYWTGAKSEVDFIIQANGLVVPIEVKATFNLKSKSLQAYINKYHPEQAFRTSLHGYHVREDFTDIPLFAILHVTSPLTATQTAPQTS